MQISTQTPDTVTISSQGTQTLVRASSAGNIALATERANVLGARRAGDDLVIKMRNGEELVIENYFLSPGAVQIVVTEASGEQFLFENIMGTEQFVFQPFSDSDAGGMSPLLLAALGGGGLLALAGGGGGGDDGGNGGNDGGNGGNDGGNGGNDGGNGGNDGGNGGNDGGNGGNDGGNGGNDGGNGGNDGGNGKLPPPTNVAIDTTNTYVTGNGTAGAIVTVTDSDGAVLGTQPVGGDGAFTVTLVPPYAQGGDITITLSDGKSQPSDPVVIEAADILDPVLDAAFNADQTQIIGTTEAGATVTVAIDGVTLNSLTAIADEDGNFTITIPQENSVNNGGTVVLSVVDKAGNTGAPLKLEASDRETPAQPENVAISADNAVVTGDGEPGTTVVITDARGVAGLPASLLGTAIVTTERTFEVVLNTPYRQGGLVKAYLTDDINGYSAPADVMALDILPPEAPTNLVISQDNLVITGKGEAGTNVTVRVSGATEPLALVAGTTTVDEYGNFTVTLADRAPNGATLLVTLTDAGNNISLPGTALNAYDLNLGDRAADNTNSLILDITPSKSEAEAKDLVSVDGAALATLKVGGTLDATALAAGKPMLLEVDPDTQRVISFTAQAGGIAVLAKYNLRVMHKVSDSPELWETYLVENNFLEVDFLGGKSGIYTASLPPGEYAVVLEAVSGVTLLTGHTLSAVADVVYDFATPDMIAGTTAGNAITDFDPVKGADLLPTGATLTGIAAGSSTNFEQVQAGGFKEIAGTFGTLTIQTNGAYSYKLNDGLTLNDVKGKTDSFSYKITDGTGFESIAKLDIAISTAVPQFGRVDAQVVLDVTPEMSVNQGTAEGIEKTTAFKLVDVDLLNPILALAALTPANSAQFTVGAGERRDMVFDADGGGITINGRYDLRIYKKVTKNTLDTNGGQTETEHWVEYFVKKDFLVVGFLGGQAKDLPVSFTEGEYAVILEGGATLGIATGISFWTNSDVTYDYKTDPDAVTGAVSGQLGAAGETVTVSWIEGETFAGSTQPLTIEGDYGVLTMQADGSYSYRVYGPQDGAKFANGTPFGAVESFTYKAMVGGKPVMTTLRISIDAAPSQDLVVDLMLETESRVVEHQAVGIDENVKYSEDGILNITLAEGTVSSLRLQSLVEYNTSTNVQRLGQTYTLEKLVGGIWVTQITRTVPPTVNKSEIDIDLGGTFGPGQYRVLLDVTNRTDYWLTNWNADLKAVSTYTDETQLADDAVLETSGSLVPLAIDGAYFTQIVVNGRTLSATADDGLAQLSITGQHGTLVVFEDGSYTYTASGESFGADRFTYKLNTLGNSEISSTLEINVGQALTTSGFDDSVTTTAGKDVITTGAGKDVVIFAEFGEEMDVWTDFSTAEGDSINLTELLPSLTEANAATSVRLTDIQHDGKSSTKISVLAEGEFRDLAILYDVNLTASDLDKLLDFTPVI